MGEKEKAKTPEREKKGQSGLARLSRGIPPVGTSCSAWEKKNHEQGTLKKTFWKRRGTGEKYSHTKKRVHFTVKGSGKKKKRRQKKVSYLISPKK